MADYIKIIQFTDSHLFGTPDKKICGLDTFRTLSDTLKLAKKNDWPPDIVFLTGDNSQDGTAESYARLSSLFYGERFPVYFLPGNHDSMPEMKSSLNAKIFHLEKEFQFGGWRFIFLDSNIEKSPKGNLKESELQFLENSLKIHPEPTMVCLHHQPVPVDCSWLDTMAVSNGEEFLEIIQSFKQVKVVLFGHVHQEFRTEPGGILIMGSPSTCFQFKPGQTHFSLDNIGPGYRWIHLFPGGQIRSGVNRLAAIPAELDLTTKGY